MKRLACLLLACAACAGDADIEGNYTVALTNRDNGCALAGWTVGEQTSGVPVAIVQEGSAANATVTGVAAIGLNLLLGTNVFTGTVDGDDVRLTAVGDVALSSGNCAYTFDGVILATAGANSLAGRVEYRAVTNNQPDCAAIAGCLSYQDFSGSRPPP